ncbi:ankyrin repeat-containing domain protein [Xylariaceae sp. FL1651]|nr:ankyrin repeat-containing domain protein [Xylariaceae sp. FL1651]
MVKVLPPPKPVLPEPPPGHGTLVNTYYDQLGRDPLQQAKIWFITNSDERVEKLQEVLKRYPKQKHRREMLLTGAARSDEAIVQCLVKTGLRVHPDISKAQQEEDAEDGSIPDKDDPFSRKVDVNARDDIGRTPLIAAASKPEVIRYLLAQGTDPTARTDANTDLSKKILSQIAGSNVLELAAGYGNIERLKLLLDHPSCDSATPSAVKMAAGGGFEALKLLLERGEYSMEDKDEIKKGELLSKNEKQTIADATGTAAEERDLKSLKDGNLIYFQVPDELHKPFLYGANKAMVKNQPDKFEFINSFNLREHDTISLDKLPEGQNINIQHLLEKPAEAGSTDCVKLMIQKYGADPNRHRIHQGMQPLYVAAAKNKSETVRYLLENHALDIHFGNGRYAVGPIALWIAIHLKALDSVALLLQHGGPADHIDEELRNLKGSSAAILKVVYKEKRPEMHLVTEDNAREYIDSARRNLQDLNPRFVHLELGPDDNEWINKIQLRKSGERLREKGDNARELDEEEGANEDELDKSDVRRLMPPVPTFLGREAELKNDDNLIPEFKTGCVPVIARDSDCGQD